MRTQILSVAILGAMLSAGTFMQFDPARAETAACPPGATCPPGDKTQKVPGAGNGAAAPAQTTSPAQATPPAQATAPAQGTGPAPGDNRAGQRDWRHRHRGHSGANIGVGIYLGDGYNGGGYHRRDYNGDVGYGYRRGNAGHMMRCGEAASIVRANGFRRVQVESCIPGRYRFLGSRRGRNFEIAVSGRGRILSVRPLY